MGLLLDMISWAASLITLLIVVRALLSWIGPISAHPLSRLVYGVTEPLLAPVRALLPDLGGVDLSPLVVILLVQLLERMLVELVLRLAG